MPILLQLLQPMILSLFRHAVTTAAGALVTTGVLQSNQTDQFLGAGLMLFGILWSIVDKLIRGETFAVLSDLHLPPVAPPTPPQPAPTPPADPASWKAVIQTSVILLAALLLVTNAAWAQSAPSWTATVPSKAASAPRPAVKAVARFVRYMVQLLEMIPCDAIHPVDVWRS